MIAQHQSLLDRLHTEVARVEEVLHQNMHSQVELVQKIGLLTLEAGGKRLRPALVAVAARATGLPFDAARARHLGAVVEMIHMATLMHDDVIDHAATRRGKPTAAATFGNTAAILSGDALLAKAMALLAADGDLEIIRTVSQAVVELAEGEVQELDARGNFDLSEEAHLAILIRKTSSLIACCCEVGARVAGADPEARRALTRYGHHLGLAFQIADDLLDYRGETAATGKVRAGDYHEGQATLPLIYIRESLSADEAAVVRRGFGNGVTPKEVDWLIQAMATRGAFARTEARAEEHARLAREALSHLPATEDRDLLEAVTDFVVRRDR